MQYLSVAWVPDNDPERDWSIAAQLAATWVDDRCSTERASGVLVTNALNHLGVPELDDFERRHARTSPRARDRVGRGAGPVLSYVPYAKELAFAMQLARNSSIAVVETISFPLAGWAARLGAWDLFEERTTPPLPDSIGEVVDRLVFHGNNSFGDDFGKKRARSVLREMDLSAASQVDLLSGALLASGLSERAIKNLSRLIERGV